jgi:hypothetical protein
MPKVEIISGYDPKAVYTPPPRPVPAINEQLYYCFSPAERAKILLMIGLWFPHAIAFSILHQTLLQTTVNDLDLLWRIVSLNETSLRQVTPEETFSNAEFMLKKLKTRIENGFNYEI